MSDPERYKKEDNTNTTSDNRSQYNFSGTFIESTIITESKNITIQNIQSTSTKDKQKLENLTTELFELLKGVPEQHQDKAEKVAKRTERLSEIAADQDGEIDEDEASMVGDSLIKAAEDVGRVVPKIAPPIVTTAKSLVELILGLI